MFVSLFDWHKSTQTDDHVTIARIFCLKNIIYVGLAFLFTKEPSTHAIVFQILEILGVGLYDIIFTSKYDNSVNFHII